MELAHSLTRLRGEVTEITDWRKQIAQHQKQVLIGAAVAGSCHRRRDRRRRWAVPPPQVVPTLSEPVRRAPDAGGAVVALESTISSRPAAPAQRADVARARGCGTRQPGRCRDDRLLDGEPRIGLDEDQAARVATTGHRQAQRARPGAGRRPLGRRRDRPWPPTATSAAQWGSASSPPAGLGGRPSRRAPESWDESAEPARARRAPRSRRGRRRQVDPRTSAPTRFEAPGGSLRRRRGRLRAHQPLSGFYFTDGGLTSTGASTAPTEVAAAMAAAGRACSLEGALVVANPVDPLGTFDPQRRRDGVCWPKGSRLSDSGRITGKAVTPFLLRPPAPRHRRRLARGQHRRRPRQRGRRPVPTIPAAAWAARARDPRRRRRHGTTSSCARSAR